MKKATVQNISLKYNYEFCCRTGYSKDSNDNASGKEDMAKGQELIDAWNGDFASINPQMYAVGNFSTYYNNFIGEFSTVGKVLYNYVDHQQTMVDGYDDQRLQSEGVASDEELEK